MYGLNEELFMSCFHAFEAETSLPWQVKGIPDVGFYKALHPYLTKFKSSITKITIGKFYIAIDPNSEQKEVDQTIYIDSLKLLLNPKSLKISQWYMVNQPLTLWLMVRIMK